MSTVKVTWKDSATLGVGKCDFCNGPLPLGLVAVLDLTAVGKIVGAGEAVMTTGEWAACQGCQGLMAIEPGAQGVDLELVRRRHQEEVDRYFRKAGRRERRALFKSQVFGGEGDGPVK
jgi:hypothetical protein